ncbi:MAG: Fur family transcriptional regulator [Armatimonadota bacterium]|nr:Fur family transcriptional regulator [Armatimonadota bacterium]
MRTWSPGRASKPPDVARALRQRGLRATASRRAVLEFLQGRGAHLAANEILDGLRRAGRPVSIATLYQNLQALSERGLLLRFFGADGVMRYDVNLHRHDHLICERCGCIVDIAPPGGDRSVRLPAGAASKHAARGWLVRSRQVEFRGVCPRCRRGEHRTRRETVPESTGGSGAASRG